MDSKRLKLPSLERDRPIRTWSTLFRSPSNGAGTATDPATPAEATTNSAPAPAPTFPDPGIGRTLADSVEAGYRVVNEYMRQAQSVAQGFNPTGSGNPQTGVPPDMQQLAQRVMQYGWDFAGMWFEMWTRMAGNANGWPAAPPPGMRSWSPSSPADSAPASTQRARPKTVQPSVQPKRLAVSVISKRQTAATFEFKPGPITAIVVHALRPEGHTAPPIQDVSVQSPDGRETLTVRVVVPPGQPPGTYSGLVIDKGSNLPRGSVTVMVYDGSSPVKARRAKRRQR